MQQVPIPVGLPDNHRTHTHTYRPNGTHALLSRTSRAGGILLQRHRGMMRLLMLWGLLSAACIHAQDIRITGAGTDMAVPISVQGLQAGDDDASRIFLHTLQVNLNRWGWFRVVPQPQQATIILRGQLRTQRNSLRIDCEVHHTGNGKRLLSERWREEIDQARPAALRLADAITEAVHGTPGIAATRIAFVGNQNGQKDLFLIDADGERMAPLTGDKVPCFGPAWGPEGNTLYYTSYVRGFPDIYRVELDSRQLTVVSREAGLNIGASVSPDGQRLALVLSRDGNPDVYVRRLADSGKPTRITRTPHAAEASPVWSPDGQHLAFVSDMQGNPHVFLIPSKGGKPQRISMRGNENVSPDWGPDGRIVYSSKRLGRYQLCLYDPRTGQETQITQTPVHHESPAWARDGRHIVYARREGRTSTLYILDSRTGTQIRLTPQAGDWYFPNWSP